MRRFLFGSRIAGRRIVGRLFAASLAAAMVGGNAMACVPTSTQQALDIIALRSTLMVSALACGQRSDYDVFMRRFQPRVLAAQHEMDAYFRSLHGRAGQRHEDTYVTGLANVQARTGERQGPHFCDQSQALFNKVLALKTVGQLEHFAMQSPARQPIVSIACGINETESFRRVADLAERP